jgi:hypothetical protein
MDFLWLLRTSTSPFSDSSYFSCRVNRPQDAGGNKYQGRKCDQQGDIPLCEDRSHS